MYAIERLGRDEVAKRLATSVASLDAWIEGRQEPPTRAVLALADLVYEMQRTAAS
jgi:DNA-binding transcriptional regulator YiaG